LIMSEQAARFIGSIPEHYDRGLGPRIFQGYAEDIARRAATTTPGAVLELAAGTGIVTRALRDALHPECRLVASDLNAPMLDVARTKFRDDESVEFEIIDATNLDFQADAFDAVVCQFGVMFFPDKERSFAEVNRVLGPGGRYLFNVWDSWDANAFARLAHELVTEFFPEEPPGFYKVPFSYADVEEIRATVAGAGFAEIEMERLPLNVEIGSPAEFARGLVFGNPLFEEIGERGGDPEQICGELENRIVEQIGDTLSLQAIVVDARAA
jgi:ubiquinone/menaquinone biosynthesis C-methylase UbiE